MRVGLDDRVDWLRFVAHLIILLNHFDLHFRFLRLLVGNEDQHVHRLAIFQKIHEFNLLVLWVVDFLAKKLKDMLPVVVSYHTKFMPTRNDQPFLLKLISVSEPHEPPLREPEEVYPVKVLLELKRQMLLLILIILKS